MTANSSPPTRQAMSAERTTSRMRSAASASTASPARWPIRSLISLKSSRSNTTSARLRLVAVRASDLARERLVEVAPVVQPGEGVEVGLLARLAKAARVLDRRRGPLASSSSSRPASLNGAVREREDARGGRAARPARRAARRGRRGSSPPSPQSRGRRRTRSRSARACARPGAGDAPRARPPPEPERRHERLAPGAERHDDRVDARRARRRRRACARAPRRGRSSRRARRARGCAGSPLAPRSSD